MIQQKFPLDFHWPVQEPFLFCAHHLDFYPKGGTTFGPESSLLRGRNMGQDFEVRNGFRMYHGTEVPGFPAHPHRGFETITIVRRGYVDHADSLGAAGRYGQGDVQWMTAGAGVQHSEMFPLLSQEKENTLELFQIWLNLPKRSKMVPAHFKMFWSELRPTVSTDGDRVLVDIVAGRFNGVQGLQPPPDSWAAVADNEVLILLVKISTGGTFKLPSSKGKTQRSVYFFSGEELSVNGEMVQAPVGMGVDGPADLEIYNPGSESEVLILQARPIGEPVVQHGPFVMNSREEIMATLHEYRNTQFGGWPWPRMDMVHGSFIERFARFPDGREETPK